MSDILSRGWGRARNTGLSGREHWPPMDWPPRVAVEVRQGTLGSDDRGWPGKETLRWSRLRSGTKHWTWLLAVAVEAKEEEEKLLTLLFALLCISP